MLGFPESILLYAVSETVLMPHTQLSVVLKEKKEIALFERAFQEGRLLGVVQRRLGAEDQIFQKGCLARITSFSESASGKIFVVLNGLARFDVVATKGERIHVSYDAYGADHGESKEVFLNRKYLSRLMEDYLNAHDIAADWDEIESSSDAYLLNSLTMACPLDPAEKQAILESNDPQEQSLMITSFIEMANPGYKDKTIYYH